MQHADQARPEGFLVLDHALHRHAAEIDAVIGALAADETNTLALALGAVILQRDLQRRIHRFRAGIGEEGIIQFARHDGLEAPRQFEGGGLAMLERRDIGAFAQHFGNRVGDFRAAMPGRRAE